MTFILENKGTMSYCKPICASLSEVFGETLLSLANVSICLYLVHGLHLVHESAVVTP